MRRVARCQSYHEGGRQLRRPPGTAFLGQLISRRRRTRGANQPIRLFQNVGICRLFPRKKTYHHERPAK